MSADTRGIHHITAIATDPQTNVDFYTGALGLRLVKKTVNFDDPGSYHLYFGNEIGEPGTALTFFAWPHGRRGSRGAGQATTTALAVPAGSLGFWKERLDAFGVVRQPEAERFGDPVLTFYDPDGLELELVATEEASALSAWSEGPIDADHAVRGFHAVTLAVRRPEVTERILSGVLGFAREAEEEGRLRLVSGSADHPGRRVELVENDSSLGLVAAGTVHHVAFRAAGDDEELAMRAALVEAGQRPTDVRERNYFRSIYFREPNGVLFEIATDGPGFPVDEPIASLGGALKLPEWLEPHRDTIARALPAIAVRPEAADPGVDANAADAAGADR